MKLYRNVHYYEKLCRGCEPELHFKGQVHTYRSLKKACQSKTSACIKGLQFNLAQMFTIVRQSVVCKIQVPVVKVKHKGQSSDKDMKMCIGII
jgi:hypothetical protein